MQIFLKSSSKTSTYNVMDCDKVEKLKRMIEEREGIPYNEQNLSCSTNLLQRDDYALKDYHVSDHSIISLNLRVQGGVQITVKNIGKGPAIGPLELELTDTVATIKSRIQELQGIPSQDVRLAFRGKNLDNEASLSSINQIKTKGSATLVMVQTKSAAEIKKEQTDQQAAKDEPMVANQLCANNCGFYGTEKTGGYCSKCFKDLGLVMEDGKTPEPEVEEKKPEEGELPKPAQTDVSRCWECNKRVGLLGYTCKCHYVFCGVHRYSDKHNCTFDYRGNQQEDLGKKLEKIVDTKVQRF